MGFLKRVSEDMAFPKPHWDQEKQQKDYQPWPRVSLETLAKVEGRHGDTRQGLEAGYAF